MTKAINFSIDLGTTNSLIAKYTAGVVEIFKNPTGLKDTLPSVVAFRKERIIVGDKAREYAERDPQNVFNFFKRKMGTSETFFAPVLNRTISPTELSAFVLKELKNFVHTGETISSVVITIPASFDTIQSNATKKAGYEAGFQEVVLLQEPIAASLAFANKEIANLTDLTGNWLVYDLGGGTFDVALVEINNGEMKVTDHEGDNFLGGLDFDNLIIEQLIVPYLQKTGVFQNLLQEMRSATGKYNKLYQLLLFKAEEIKIALSAQQSTEFEMEITDDEKTIHDIYLPITRNEFEACINSKIDYSIDLVNALLLKNNVTNKTINQVILIGGSTYIPLVKKKIESELGMTVNQSVDPTNAVVVGAAYYAGNKNATFVQTLISTHQDNNTAQDTLGFSNKTNQLYFKTAYQKTTQDSEEFFVALVTGETANLQYRIVREDGGFDSGLKRLTAKINEVLPLINNITNRFFLKIIDENGTIIATETPIIEITQGKFNIYGQPLPNDICIEIDDLEENTTKLELIFEKNAILPLKRTFVKTISKTIVKNSEDSLIINVLEGDRYATPTTCLPLGIIEIRGADIALNLVKGSDVEITLAISESRDLKIEAVLLMTDQEYGEVFSPSVRYVHLEKLKTELIELLREARNNLNEFNKQEKYELAGQVSKIEKELGEIYEQLKELRLDDVTDDKYKIEKRKRGLAQALDLIVRDKEAETIKAIYFEAKHDCESWVTTDETKKPTFQQIIAAEREFLASNNKTIIKLKTKELNDLAWKISQKDPTRVAGLFHFYSFKSYPDEKQQEAKRLINMGEKALERQNYDEVLAVVYALYALLPQEKKTEDRAKGTGLS